MATRQTPNTRAKDSDRNDTCAVLDSALGDGQLSNEEHRQRVASATTASTLGELQNLVADLQTSNAPVQLPDLRPARLPGTGWGIKAAIAAVLVVLGIGIGWGLYGNTSSPLSLTPNPGAPGARDDGIPGKVLSPPRQLQSLDGINAVFDQMRKKFGDTTGYELGFYTDYAILTRSDPAEPRQNLRYIYRGGGFDDPDPDTSSQDGPAGDLAAFDVPAVIGVLRGAPVTLGISPTEVESVYMWVRPSQATPGTVDISISVSDKFNKSGGIELKGDGQQIVRQPSR